MHRDGSRHKDPSRWAILAAAVLAIGGAVIVVALTDPPHGGALAWVLLVLGLGIVTCGVGVLAAVLHWLVNVMVRLAHKARRTLRMILAIGLVPALTIGLLYASLPLIARANVLIFGCEYPAQVRVLTTPELLDAYRAVADGYERFAAERNHRCRTAELFVYASPPVKGREGLMAGWSAESLRDNGPQPDVWLPDTTQHVDAVRANKQQTGLGPDLHVIDSIGYTPIVLGIPLARVAQDDGRRLGTTWAGLRRAIEEANWGLARPAPEASTAGEFGTVAIYTSEGGGVGLRENPATAQKFEQLVTRSLADGGYPAGADTPALLRRQAQLGADGKPILLPEHALFRFNDALRKAAGRGCDVSNGLPACLLAFYPSDTHRLDLPFVRLNWPGEEVSEEQRVAAEGFGNWLTSDAGRAALVDVGVRARTEGPAPKLNVANGVRQGLPGIGLDNPPKAVRDEMMAVYDIVRRPGRLLISLDASGSMRAPAGDGTRYTVAVSVIRQALESLAGRKVDLNVFSATIGIQRVTTDGLGQVGPAGNTPQYRAIVEGMRSVGPGGVLLLVTDGVNNVDDVSRQQLLDQTAAGGVRVLVLAFGEASCANQALADVTSVTGGRCLQSTVDSLAADLADLLPR